MANRAKLFQAKAALLTFGVFLGLAGASIAWGDSTGNLQEVNKKVEPAVVFIQNGKDSVGSGFVVDPKGIIATNMHVIDGAKELTITFPSNKDEKKYKAEGFIDVSRGKDIALIVIKSDDGKPFPVLKIAEKKPEVGEWIAAFGSPLGLTGTASLGNVSALRMGKDLLESEMHVKLYQSSGYDAEAEWIQITAPISPGNSGGPLVNAQGEVVGINTWVIPGSMSGAQALNFSISTKHLKEFLAKAGTNVKPFASLPKPSFDHGGGGGPSGPPGDPQKTLALWKQFNKALNELYENVTDCDSKLEKIPALDPRNAPSAQNKRNKKVSDVYKKYASAYKEHAGKVRELKNDKVDPDLIKLVLTDAILADMLSATYQKVATAVLNQGGSRENEFRAVDLKQADSKFRTDYDVLRHNLGAIYNKDFPTLEETASESTEDAKEEIVKTNEKKDKSQVREWTDASGKHKTKAKFVGVDKDKGVVKLEKTDGSVISVPITSLSEADQQFLGESK